MGSGSEPTTKASEQPPAHTSGSGTPSAAPTSGTPGATPIGNETQAHSSPGVGAKDANGMSQGDIVRATTKAAGHRI